MQVRINKNEARAALTSPLSLARVLFYPAFCFTKRAVGKSYIFNELGLGSGLF